MDINSLQIWTRENITGCIKFWGTMKSVISSGAIFYYSVQYIISSRFYGNQILYQLFPKRGEKSGCRDSYGERGTTLLWGARSRKTFKFLNAKSRCSKEFFYQTNFLGTVFNYFPWPTHRKLAFRNQRWHFTGCLKFRGALKNVVRADYICVTYRFKYYKIFTVLSAFPN